MLTINGFLSTGGGMLDIGCWLGFVVVLFMYDILQGPLRG
jgi:hypothetical protein